MYYFGRWDDPDAAEREYLEVADHLHAGREPRQNNGGLTLLNLCNSFIKAKRAKMDGGNLSPRTFIDYDRCCKRLLDEFGLDRSISDLRPIDFEKLYAKLGHKYGISSLGGEITMTRSVFKYAFEMDLIESPVKFGPQFKSPSNTDLRKAKAKHKNGSRTFEAAEIQQMLANAGPQLKAMIFLGINGGMGNTDCAALPLSALELDAGWLDFPRPKTGADRRIPLWLETVIALREAIANRKEPNDPADVGLVFMTNFGQRWVRFELPETKRFGRVSVKAKQDDAVSKETAKLLRKLKLKRPGLSFYSLRHTLDTVAGGSRDQVAVDAIMGHIDSSMAANYRHGIEDERLKVVVDYVHGWLFGDSEAGGQDDE